ncbi:DNA helicase [Maritalea sp.]|jgi:replicative DNA helicase|uniref:DNA helicase n=1 Tax=Maritalea sp. TaxID=2003361 RepID=UPI0039E72B21
MKLSAPIHNLKRQARLLARQEQVSLHQALDQIASREGFSRWSLLISRFDGVSDAEKAAQSFQPGDLVLLGGRPGHGKTRIGLAIAYSKMAAGHDAYFFTLEYHAQELNARLGDMGFDNQSPNANLVIDTSDDICAEYITSNMGIARSGAVVVIDYLQILDQRRSTPDLDVQLKQLQSFARKQEVTLILISQIDRAFEHSGRDFPGLVDVRQPNPIDLRRFNRSCFVHNNKLRWNKAA